MIIGGNLMRLSKESGMQITSTSVCEKQWPQETDNSKSNFHYLPEFNNC